MRNPYSGPKVNKFFRLLGLYEPLVPISMMLNYLERPQRTTYCISVLPELAV